MKRSKELGYEYVKFAAPSVRCTVWSDLKELHLSEYGLFVGNNLLGLFSEEVGWCHRIADTRWALALCSMPETLIRCALRIKLSPWLQIDRLLSYVERIKSLKSVPGTEAPASNVVNYRGIQARHFFPRFWNQYNKLNRMELGKYG